MIPKKIHYCWFGGNPLSALAIKCIDSWKKYCPDYEIIEWNENNFDINCCDYVKEAYKAKKWAFVSDVARLYALVNYGGIYMDTDVEVLKPLDDLLLKDAFSGFESKKRIPTGIMACVQKHPLFVEFLNEYDNTHFIHNDGTLNMTTNVERITKTCLTYGINLNNSEQTIKGFTLYPKDYFCPKDAITQKIIVTKNTYTIHHFNASWVSAEDVYAKKMRLFYSKFLPRIIVSGVARISAMLKYRGFKGMIKGVLEKLKRSAKYDT